MATDRVKAQLAQIVRLSDYEQACLVSYMIDPAQGCPSMFHGDDWLCDVLFEARDVANKLLEMTDPDNVEGYCARGWGDSWEYEIASYDVDARTDDECHVFAGNIDCFGTAWVNGDATLSFGSQEAAE